MHLKHFYTDETLKNMRASEKIVDKVPRFVRTLYDILTDEDQHILSWSTDGTHFQVYDVPRLEQEILPKYFKHCKFASFQRQLNNFGFRKWTKTRASVCTFSHEFLRRCHPAQLAILVAEMESYKAAICAASNVGTKRPIGGDDADERIIDMSMKRLHTEDNQEDEREPEHEMATFDSENLYKELTPLAGFEATDLLPLAIATLSSISTETNNSSFNVSTLDTLPPLDVDYIGESWTDIFDEVPL
ncbi:hypothetical protein BBO99_00009429 [Phytophthora kernoviae]|uniref:HSF-type DNA-binding domain-containing protein n=1 Tax=Phytophthora kernoviae TaxID=325452 RepID=A0A3R7JYA4_9STRA|nr:hypothetical protein JM18_009347 [Phytophthora kernoviae]RLN32767.1 hypothetical protein BBI17_009458 [Phytophthora kernoviae]RLN73409.1 hypothetical protein BBO99_00009429 [Phytophthora kernoviae]